MGDYVIERTRKKVLYSYYDALFITVDLRQHIRIINTYSNVGGRGHAGTYS